MSKKEINSKNNPKKKKKKKKKNTGKYSISKINFLADKIRTPAIKWALLPSKPGFEGRFRNSINFLPVDC